MYFIRCLPLGFGECVRRRSTCARVLKTTPLLWLEPLSWCSRLDLFTGICWPWPNRMLHASLCWRSGRISHFKFRPDRAFRTENMGLGIAPNPRWVVENVAEHDGCPMLQDSEDGDRSRHHLHDERVGHAVLFMICLGKTD